jgi:hypothetical protein
VGLPPRGGGHYRQSTPTKLTPDTFDRLANDCVWISEHVNRALYEAKLARFVDLRGNPLEPPVPPLLPRDGEPLP